MENTENLVKVGDVVLSPKAIEFIAFLQTDDNNALKLYNQMLLEQMAATLITINDASMNESMAEKLTANMKEISYFIFNMTDLAKP